MRTTIDIPDSLMKKAKIKAAQEGVTLKKLLIHCLEKELYEPHPGHHEAPWKSLRGKGSAGDLTPCESGFEGYSGPDWHHGMQIKEPDS